MKALEDLLLHWGLDITFGTECFIFSPRDADSYKYVLTHLVLKNLEQISFVDSLDSPGLQLSPHTCWQLGIFQRERDIFSGKCLLVNQLLAKMC